MKQIEVSVLNPEAIQSSVQMLVAMARLTQRGADIKNMTDFKALMGRPYDANLVEMFVNLPHPTLQKFGVINIAVVGASRRFLAQITRHQNEVKFMSGSLQYSDYTDKAQFVIPYEVFEAEEKANTQFEGRFGGRNEAREHYLNACKASMEAYKVLATELGNDAAGYAAPQGLRNTLIISATPYQLKHMIAQRVCRRNTPETRYVMLLIWEALQHLDSSLFNDTTGPMCFNNGCPEGKMSCGQPIAECSAKQLLDREFPLLRGF